MRVQLTKTWSAVDNPFQLTKDEIEQQALIDLSRYAQAFYKKYRKGITEPIDIDNFVEELWGVRIAFEDIKQTDEESEILGYLDPTNQRIVVDADRCRYDRRISFTIAHEAGHLSLHASMLQSVDGKIVAWVGESIPHQKGIQQKNDKGWRLEWQANHYASSLLAPKHKLLDALRELNLINNSVLSPVDLALHADALLSKFNLSRQALEIRLKEMKIPMVNKRY